MDFTLAPTGPFPVFSFTDVSGDFFTIARTLQERGIPVNNLCEYLNIKIRNRNFPLATRKPGFRNLGKLIRKFFAPDTEHMFGSNDQSVWKQIQDT